MTFFVSYNVNLVSSAIHAECAQPLRKRTDTTHDQDCVLQANVQVCTACMDVSLLKTCMNFNTPPLAQVALFDTSFASDTRMKTRLPTQSVQASECRSDLQRLMFHHSLVLRKRLLSLSSSRVVGLLIGVCKVCSPNRAMSQYSRNFVLLVALALPLLC